MSSGPQIVASVETDPIILDRERAVLLEVGQTRIDVEVDSLYSCREACALGEKACGLTLTTEYVDREDKQHEMGSLAVKARCADCPNPNLALAAVQGVVDLSERRYEAVTSVNFGDVPRTEADPKIHDDIFHLVEDEENGDYHVISVEALEDLGDADGGFLGRLSRRALGVITREWAASRPYQAERTLVVSNELKSATESRSDMFLVAEGLQGLLEIATQRDIRQFGPQLENLIARAHEQAVAAGIPQEATPELDVRDKKTSDITLISEVYNYFSTRKIWRFGDIAKLNSDDIVEDVGEQQLGVVRNALAEVGLHFKNETPEA